MISHKSALLFFQTPLLFAQTRRFLHRRNWFEEHLIRFEQQNSPPFTCVNSGLSFYIDAIVAYCICIKKMCLFVIGQDITIRIDARGVEHLVVFVLLVACERNTYTVSGVIE